MKISPMKRWITAEAVEVVKFARRYQKRHGLTEEAMVEALALALSFVIRNRRTLR